MSGRSLENAMASLAECTLAANEGSRLQRREVTDGLFGTKQSISILEQILVGVGVGV